MRKTSKRKSQLTLSAEKVRELQAADLGDVAGGKTFCGGSSFGCIDSFTCKIQ